MMSIEYIQAESRRAARRSAREHKGPFVFAPHDLDSRQPFPFPFIGCRVPRGWKLRESLFCDSSGFGAPDEPALTVDQLRAKLRELHAAEPGLGYAITEVGQFQVYLGVFERVQPRAKRAKVQH